MLQWYRLHWQVELVSKCFGSLAYSGRLPKSDAESIKAWLYGKLLRTADRKIVRHARTMFLCGYDVQAYTEYVAGIVHPVMCVQAESMYRQRFRYECRNVSLLRYSGRSGLGRAGTVTYACKYVLYAP